MEDIRHLRSFLCVAEHLNFTRAAEQLFISQSTLSKHIAEMEEQLGVQLFIRTHHSVKLTPPGLILFDESRGIMAKIGEVFERTRKAQLAVWGTLRIGCLGIEYAFLPKILKHFTALYPHVTLDIQVMSGTMINEALAYQELDIGFNQFIGNEFTSEFKVREVRRSRLCFLLPRNHPFANRYSLDFSDLKHEQFILLAAATFPNGMDWILNQCKRRDFRPNIVSQPARLETLFWQVTAGLGISLWCFDSVFCQLLRHNIALVAMTGFNAYGHIGLVWKKENPNPIIPLFLKEFDRLEIPKRAQGKFRNQA